MTYLPLDVTHKLLTSDARLQQLAAVNTQASKRVVDILNVYIKHDMALYGMPSNLEEPCCRNRKPVMMRNKPKT